MQFLRQCTAATVAVQGVVSIADGYTDVTTLDISTADSATIRKHGGTVVSIAARTWAATTGADGDYDLTFTAADTGTPGHLNLKIVDVSLCLPVFAEFMVMPQQVWDSLFSTDKLQVHAAEISDGLVTAAAIAADAITSEKFDESSAFPLKSADSGTTALARATVLRASTIQGAGANTLTLDASASSTDDIYLDARVEIVSGTGTGQERRISAYAGGTKIATLSSGWTTLPQPGDGYRIVVEAPAHVSQLPADYDAAKTAAQAGDAMTLEDGALAKAKFATDALDDQDKLKDIAGLVAGKVVTNAAGTSVQLYDEDGNLVVTLAWSATTLTWTPTWE